jgi:nitrous oxidase accessory protein
MKRRAATVWLLGLVVVVALRAQTAGDRLRTQIATSTAGAVLQVPAGDYEGSFVIDRPLHLIGARGAVLHGTGHGNVVAVRASDVEIAGFVVRGSGRSLFDDNAAIYITGARASIHDNRILDMLHGIYVRKADDCRIVNNVVFGDGAQNEAIADPVIAGLKVGDAASGELCSVPDPQDRRGNGIHLWNSSGHFISGNTIQGTRDGIYFSFTSHTVVEDNRISHVRYGLHYMYSDENVFSRNLFTENAAGAALMYSKKLLLEENRFVANRSHRAYGLLMQSIDDTRVERNVIAGNTVGLFLENGNNNTVRANRIAGNYVGLRVSDSTAGSRFFENTFLSNIHPLETSGGNAANLWAVAGRGNYWDDAASLDLNRDGIADLPHHEPDLFGAWRRTFPAIGLLSASPGERLLRLIHSRLALPGLPGVTDPRPLVSAPTP